jgi:hypothetical protein
MDMPPSNEEAYTCRYLEYQTEEAANVLGMPAKKGSSATAVASGDTLPDELKKCLSVNVMPVKLYYTQTKNKNCKKRAVFKRCNCYIIKHVE